MDMEIPTVHFSQTPALIKRELTDSDIGLMQFDYIQSGIPQTGYLPLGQLSTPPCWIKEEPPERNPETAPNIGVSQATPVPDAHTNRHWSLENSTVNSLDVPGGNGFKMVVMNAEVLVDEHQSDQPMSLSNHTLQKTPSAVIGDLSDGDRPTDTSPVCPPLGKQFGPVIKLENTVTSTNCLGLDRKDTIVMKADYAKSEFSDVRWKYSREVKHCSKSPCKVSNVVIGEACKVSDVVVGTGVVSLDSVSTSSSAGSNSSTSVRRGLDTAPESTNGCETSESTQNITARRIGREHLKRRAQPGSLTELGDYSSDEDWADPPRFRRSTTRRRIRSKTEGLGSQSGNVITSETTTSWTYSPGVSFAPQGQESNPIPSVRSPQRQESNPIPSVRSPQRQESNPIPSAMSPESATGLDVPLPVVENCKQAKVPYLAARQFAEAMTGPKYLSELTTEEVEELKKLRACSEDDTLEPVFRVKCDMCSWAFRDLNSLVTHMSQKHETSLEKPFLCELCDKSVEGRNHFFFHYGQRKSGYCETCGLSFRRAKEHINRHNNPYGCRTCGKRFINVMAIKGHLHESENHLPENKCPHCSSIIRLGEFSKHVSYHLHGFPYKCDICSYQCSARSTLATHKLIHTEKKDKKCPHCDLSFLSDERVKGHIKYAHTAKSFLCSVCGKSYTVGRKLRYHMLTHEERKFQCEICGKNFYKNLDLRGHTRNTHASTKVQCDTCGKLCSSKAALFQHMDVHRDDMPHECPVCKKKFKRKQNMKSHLRTHGEDRKFKCEVCGDGFKWAHNLRNHLKKHDDKLSGGEIQDF